MSALHKRIGVFNIQVQTRVSQTMKSPRSFVREELPWSYAERSPQVRFSYSVNSIFLSRAERTALHSGNPQSGKPRDGTWQLHVAEILHSHDRQAQLGRKSCCRVISSHFPLEYSCRTSSRPARNQSRKSLGILRRKLLAGRS